MYIVIWTQCLAHSIFHRIDCFKYWGTQQKDLTENGGREFWSSPFPSLIPMILVGRTIKRALLSQDFWLFSSFLALSSNGPRWVGQLKVPKRGVKATTDFKVHFCIISTFNFITILQKCYYTTASRISSILISRPERYYWNSNWCETP
jgi:hypothetical protein